MPRYRRITAGFTLVDIMAALFVIVVGVLSSYTLLVGGRRLSGQSQIQTAAYQVARQELEDVKAYKLGNRAVTAGTPFTIPDTILAQFPNQSFSGSYSISNFGAYTSPPAQQIA